MLYLNLPLLLYIFIAFLLSLIIFFLSYFLIKTKVETEKFTSYECGFEPFNDARSKMDIRFYVIALLFLIFDLEIVFLMSWALDYYHLGSDSFFSVFFFLFLLIIGFVYEWKKGALD